MITSELISYIKKQIENNISKDLIISKLLNAGWHRDDIDEGLLEVEKSLTPKTEIQIEKPVEQKQDISKIPEISSLEIEAPKTEIFLNQTTKIEVPKEIIKEEIDTEKTKVWVPMSAPVSEIKEVEKPIIENYREPIEEVKKEEKITIKEDLIPNLIPKNAITPITPVAPVSPVAYSIPSTPVSNLNKEYKPEAPKMSFSESLPQMAMLSSYKSDLLSVKDFAEVSNKNNKGKIIKWIIILIIFLAVVGVGLLFYSGYFNLKNFNIPFVKKDPKILLLNNSKILSSLGSYKTETNIEISSPSFSNISSGLISGEAVASLDKDTFSVSTLGVINQNKEGLLADNFFTFKSSVIQDPITFDVKNNGSDLFVSVPDLSQIIKENSPKPDTIRINQKEFELIPPLFSLEVESWIKKINFYKLLSSGMSSYINNDTLGAYDEFINNVEITEKGQDNIKGIDTYHYSIVPDRQFSKKLLAKIAENFVLNLSDDDNRKLNEIIGSTTVDSFDVWVGKGDNNIYQYSVVVDIPLSKILGFEDKSIGDNKVNISWKTTYFDFNISNNVLLPEKPTNVVDFVNNIKESKIKNDVVSFKPLATSVFNAEGSYGSKSNTSGSCMKPTPASLFSPVGHIKGATSAISSVSELLNSVMNKTNGAGYCYSTNKTWSFTVPVSINYDIDPITGFPNYKYFYCIDSTGSTKELVAPPTGVVCK